MIRQRRRQLPAGWLTMITPGTPAIDIAASLFRRAERHYAAAVFEPPLSIADFHLQRRADEAPLIAFID